ncbi:MAG TPA: sigma-54 dependent transcriptional regulator [Myxococcota bacterium]|nr:sigma-54 dependent transcriptional regulator [Myxococcota bacterium]
MTGSPTAHGLSVLVVDDEKNIRTTLTLCLEGVGCEVKAVSSADAALAAVQREAFDAAFVDLRLADDSGLDLIPKLLAQRGDMALVVITAYATVETAVLAMRRGAYDYLQKPFTPAQIRHEVERIAQWRALRARVAELEAELGDQAPGLEFESDSAAMRVLFDTARRVAESDVPALLRGESGTGKSAMARALHRLGPRRAGPFVTVSCPTLTEELLASELFGHARGAYTGAVQDQAGRVEAAQGGTLFLDEIGELPPALQAKLLRFLQDHEFERVGETRTRTADVRVIAATNRDLEEDVRAGRFREDLLYRLNVVELVVPPLRERPEDVLPLARSFLAYFSRTAKRAPLELSPETEDVLLRYSWPGNVRELRNAMERIAILWPAQRVEPAALPDRTAPLTPARPRVGGDFTLEAVEREHIEQVVARSRTQEEAARVLGVDPSTLWRRRKRAEQG